MKFEISLENIKFYAFHGVDPQEGKVGNEFEVFIKVTLPVGCDFEEENLESTISYADLYEIVKKEMAIPSKLLESVAYRIKKTITGSYPQIEGGEISIRKVTPPISGIIGSACVKLIF